ncbi:MAG: protein translocase subunit SecD [Acidobacteria bacterium]|nr:protein translocase subunit SecD [Acidobacteriota bacterium]
MNSTLRNKALFVLAIILVCVYGIIGLPKSKAELLKNWNNNIRLGLDLRGGSQLVLQVQVQDAFKAEADQTIDRLRTEMQKDGVTYTVIDRNDPQKFEDAETIEILVKGVAVDKVAAFREVVNSRFANWNFNSISSSDFRLTYKPTEAILLRSDTVKRSISTIEARINGLGLAEATVQQRGGTKNEAEILVQMPGVDDPARVKTLIGQPAMLEITDVKGGPFPDRPQALAQNGGVLPLGTKLARERARPGATGESWWLLGRNAVITGRDLRNARPSQDEFGKWETSFTLSQDASKRFGRFTEANINNKLAVVLDNQIFSVATIQNKIEDSGRITNIGDQTQASDLALTLTSGSLPAGIVYLDERTVGASLGADSVHDGLLAGVVGVVVVVLAMLFYYKRAGINATLALVLNAIILLAALSYFGAVLTLPGIAGFILTIGMAVDSNVLIFERIREELRHGKGVVAAIETGFGKAFLTIIDTHVTTVVSCAFLFAFGSTAVKGFAITLVIGLIANVFTAVFVSKFIFDWENYGKKQLTTLSI